METKTTDDIGALCGYAQIEPVWYKRFQRAFPGQGASSKTPVASAPSAQPESVPPAAPPRQPCTRDGRAEVITMHPSALPRRPAATPHAASVPLPRRGLRQAWSAIEADDVTRTPEMVAIYGACGGVGKTTIAASLARALAMLDEQVAVVDAGRQSSLPYFFGSSNQQPGIHPVDSSRGASAPLYLVRSGEDAGAEENLWQDLAQLDGTAGHILVDTWPSIPQSLEQNALAKGFCLVIMTPEVRSILGLGALLESIRRQEERLEHPIEVYFLLNRFDPRLAHHAEIRDHLAERFGSHFLPFTIGRADGFEEALSMGQTILDTMPESEASAALFALAKWFRAKMRPDAPEVHRSALTSLWHTPLAAAGPSACF